MERICDREAKNIILNRGLENVSKSEFKMNPCNNFFYLFSAVRVPKFYVHELTPIIAKVFITCNRSGIYSTMWKNVSISKQYRKRMINLILQIIGQSHLNNLQGD